MRTYNDLVRELDSDGARHSQDLSEVDLTDPDDVKVAIADPSGEVLVHLGASNFLERYKIYVTHVQEWRQQFEKLESVDLRYDRQIIVNPDLRGAPRPEALSPSAAKAAMNAGVKRAALVNYERFASHPVSSASKGQPKTDHSLIAKVQAPQGPALQTSAVVKTKPASSPAPKAVAKKHTSNSSVTKKPAKKAHKKSAAKAPPKKPAVSAAPATVQGKSIPSQASPGSSKKKPSAAIEKDQGHS